MDLPISNAVMMGILMWIRTGLTSCELRIL